MTFHGCNLFAFFLFLTSLTVQAGILSERECPSIDLRDVRPDLKSYLDEPLDQGPLGWCYGFVAADLLTAELGEMVSPFHLSVLYNRSIERNPLAIFGRSLFSSPGLVESVYEGGFTHKTIKEAVANHWVCNESELPYVDQRWNRVSPLRLLQYLNALREEHSGNLADFEFAEKLMMDYVGRSDERLGIGQELMRNRISTALANSAEVLCHNPIEVPELRAIRRFKPNQHEYSNREYDSREQYLSEKRGYIRNVYEVLRLGRPLGVSYRSRMVAPSGSRLGIFRRLMSNAFVDHISTVTAQRWNANKNRCEIKVRNSWGQASCSTYKRGIECDSQEGSFWVDDETFFEMSGELVFIRS